ncbi:MAG: restriction endonuclease subunit S [Pikeienuella sp.]|uniref:restriction endonuclease subunit S n=1 Tax=Pikeienuella sp. TaxID=2831957 RepID=UPI00391B5F8F
MIRVDQAGAVRLGRQRSPDKHTGRHATKYLRAANITPAGLDLSDLLEMDFTPRERQIFALVDGDILLTEASGSAIHVGRAALWRGEIDPCCFQNTVVRFRPHLALSRYALIVFRHYAASGVFAHVARGVGIQHLGASRFAALHFPLPPQNEQQRIAVAADRRLQDIRKAETLLRSALDRLGEQMRETLAAAAAGELAEQRPDQAGDKRLHDLASGRSGGPQGNPLDVIERATEAEDVSLGPLPPGWRWVRVAAAGEVTLGRQRAPQHQHGPHMRPYLRVANVFEERIDTSDVLEMNFTPEEAEVYTLKAGDILLNEGQSPELVGRPAMYREEIPGACFQNTLIRFRAGDGTDPDYALLVFRHYLHSGVFRRIARWSTNIAHLGLERFRALLFPLPPLEEQRRIVAETRLRLTSISAQIQAVEASISRLPEMEAELLAAAVTGELVEQDPADETAAALIERLGPPPSESRPANDVDKRKEPPPVTVKRPSASRRQGPNTDLAEVLREAGTPLKLPELFGQAGFDRDEPEHVELFYLALRSQLGSAIRQVRDGVENAELETIDAA